MDNIAINDKINTGITNGLAIVQEIDLGKRKR
jgi:hypothetical protein